MEEEEEVGEGSSMESSCDVVRDLEGEGYGGI